jgi:hypothetical protein
MKAIGTSKASLVSWAVVILFVMIGQGAAAASKQAMAYSIDNAWYDADSIYFSYTKTESKVHYSLSDINGTMIVPHCVVHES